jgi:hypothetical protein
MTPKRGALAYCSMKTLGLITSDAPLEITYRDGQKGIAWTGVHLSSVIAPIGSPWSSRTPEVISYVSGEMIDLLMRLAAEGDAARLNELREDIF